jgi:hypothetical protein
MKKSKLIDSYKKLSNKILNIKEQQKDIEISLAEEYYNQWKNKYDFQIGDLIQYKNIIEGEILDILINIKNLDLNEEIKFTIIFKVSIETILDQDYYTELIFRDFLDIDVTEINEGDVKLIKR